ncbi:growth arrest-specific protein 1-like [Ambystoma mexicanum]|uniref:growth arrest-specific protein 1-like n=1 Tax=Ambystoma mexicanum TaxID=8296 RepID=UPI0037E74525
MRRWTAAGDRGAEEPYWDMISKRPLDSGSGWSPVLLAPLWWLLLFLSCLSRTGLAGAPCWEALLRCQAEQDCTAAYEQYQVACETVLGLESRSFQISSPTSQLACPSHCIAALVHLNQTQAGPALEGCECGRDRRCQQLQAAIEPCLPRTSVTGGCMRARLHCEQDPACQRPLAAYLARCGQLFNGRRCTAACRDTIEQLLASESGPPLQQCVCDGPERPFCEVLKVHMGRLCFGLAGELRPVRGSIEEEDGDYEEDDEEDEDGVEEESPQRESPQADKGKGRALQPTPLLILGVLLKAGL